MDRDATQVRKGEFDGKPRLTIVKLRKTDENQVEVECQLTTYNLKTVTFKVTRLETSLF